MPRSAAEALGFPANQIVVSAQKAAVILDVSVRKVRTLIDHEELEAFRIDRSVKISVASITDYLERNRRVPSVKQRLPLKNQALDFIDRASS